MAIETIIRIGFYLLVLWYIIFLAGTFQFRSLKRKTETLVLIKAKAWPETEPVNCEEIFQTTYPEWCEMVTKVAIFIPSKSELRPISASIQNVETRLGFSPQWIKDYLEKQGFSNLQLFKGKK
jgi:hypothetical protein